MEERLFPISRDEIILKYLDRYALPIYIKSRIESILDGSVSEESLRCCSSGCNVCAETIFNCLNSVKKELKNVI
jgi:hypothetical protein